MDYGVATANEQAERQIEALRQEMRGYEARGDDERVRQCLDQIAALTPADDAKPALEAETPPTVDGQDSPEAEAEADSSATTEGDGPAPEGGRVCLVSRCRSGRRRRGPRRSRPLGRR